MTVAKEVVQFLMGIFGDRQAAQGFLDDPEGVLEKHGLAGVSSADVDAAMPVVLDYAPLSVTASASDRDFNSGAGTGHAGGGGSPLPAGGHDDHGQAVEQLTHVVANYSYSSTPDDRGAAMADQSPAPNIWADGDVEQWFDNDSVPAFGDPAIGAGTGMGFADIRIDGLFDLDADSETATAGAHGTVLPATLIDESFTEEQQAFVEVDVDPAGAGLEFTEDDAATIDIDNDIDDAGAGEAADSMDFGA